MRVGRATGDYSVFNDTRACLMHLREYDVLIQPGQNVQYVITNAGSRRLDRVCPEPLIDEATRYDAEAYITYLCRAAESLLLPFDYTADTIRDTVRGAGQSTLNL